MTLPPTASFVSPFRADRDLARRLHAEPGGVGQAISPSAVKSLTHQPVCFRIDSL
jgi:hypothetical protein